MVIALQLHRVFTLDALAALVFVQPLAREDFDVDDDAFDARRHGQRRIFHIAGLFAEDRAEQLFFRRQLGLALRRDLADQNVARLHLRTDADDAALVEIPKRFFAHIRNVAGDVLFAQLGIAGFDFELLDVDRRECVLAYEFLTQQDRVFEVVAAPGHECHEHVLPQRQFALIDRRPVGQYLAFLDRLPDPDHRRLRDAGVLVRALELDQVVNVQP